MKILITGANRGLGNHLTKMALEKGHSVAAGVRSIKEAEQQMKHLKDQYQNTLLLVELDVTSEQNINQVVNQIEKQWGYLDSIINNAAIMIEREKTVEDLDMDKVRLTFEVNTFGPMRIVQHFLPLIYAGENQAIINISSEAGTIMNAFPTNYPYSMSKTALNMFSERLKEYLKDKRIRVYAVHPGWMKTDMGGMEAPYEPENTAAKVINIMEGKVKSYSKIAFIDFNGRPMPL
ncbi:SDR family NAD(P)-dependent oxidoreductase [Aquibacillus halophilus]|uniref:SDR family NAD(P)-dependent oxidoreductase n=1 Tax=Aquibacillus halophilus TaxID=930132 RepID=A0A6A8D7M4_9BACI|nr:SDR family oxidoreductase [Aquibacillus halophilus]MRH41594.1 SDR family NAD(P)-dependent oxidoreductase [Aquibacillus halophilus]